MSEFTHFNAYEHVVGIKYRLTEDLVWRVGHSNGEPFVVPQGKVFDVSVPRYLRWAVDPHDPRFLPPSAVHDYMLEQGWYKASAAAEFYNALMAKGVTPFERFCMGHGVVAWTVR